MSQKPEKPLHGQPCNGCGGCCIQVLCPLAKAVLGDRIEPCPALIDDGDHYSCGLMVDPGSYAPIRTAIHGKEVMAEAARLLMGSGRGCDAWEGPGEIYDEAFIAAGRQHYRQPHVVRAVILAKHVWCVSTKDV